MKISPQLINNLKQSQGDTIKAFTVGPGFSHNPTTGVIRYIPDDPNGAEYLLHEVGHAQRGHSSIESDVELLRMEREAWDTALILAKEYGVEITDTVIEDSLDSYRDWLHARSQCPRCAATGYQSKPRTYTCPSCHQQWRVNEARTCALRRYKTK